MEGRIQREAARSDCDWDSVFKDFQAASFSLFWLASVQWLAQCQNATEFFLLELLAFDISFFEENRVLIETREHFEVNYLLKGQACQRRMGMRYIEIGGGDVVHLLVVLVFPMSICLFFVFRPDVAAQKLREVLDFILPVRSTEPESRFNHSEVLFSASLEYFSSLFGQENRCKFIPCNVNLVGKTCELFGNHFGYLVMRKGAQQSRKRGIEGFFWQISR